MKTIKFLSLSIAVILMSACGNEDDLVTDNNPGIIDGDIATVEIKLANSSAPRATEPGTEDENALKSLEFYVFDASGAKDATTGYYYVAGDDVKRTTKLQISSTGANVQFVVVANAAGVIGAKDNYNDLKAALASGEFKTPNSPTAIPTTGLEMSGMAKETITGGINNSVTVIIDRLVSKFEDPTFVPSEEGGALLQISDVDLVELWGADVEIDKTKLTFTYGGYALVNGISKSILMRADWATTWDEAAWTAWSTGKTYLKSTFDDDGNYSGNYSGNATDGWFAKDKVVYAYENAPKPITSGAGSGYDPETVYALIIKGELKAEGVTETKTRYWRVNIDKEADYKIGRNGVYRININTIKSAGFETAEEAETNDPIVPIDGDTYVDITVVVNGWTIITLDGEM